MPDDLLIALNPEEDSSLPYLVRIPLGAAGIVLKTRDTWPRTSKVYCHRAVGWPADAEVILRVPVRRCRRGAAIDLVLDRARENRSQFVITSPRSRNDLLAIAEDDETSSGASISRLHERVGRCSRS